MSHTLEGPISAIISHAIPHATPTISAITELPDTHLNTLFDIELSSGASRQSTILKLAPPPDIRLLRCDQAFALAEAANLRRIQRSTTLPVPSIIGYDTTADIIGSPYLLLSKLPGTLLSSSPVPVLLEATRAAGSHLRTLSTIKPPHNGYGPASDDSPAFDTWRSAFLSLVEGLISDAEEAMVQLPYGAIRTQLRRLCMSLDAVKKPRLSILDFDSRKVLVTPQPGGEVKVTGLLGFGSVLWGDPLVARWFRDRTTEEGREFLLGYFGNENVVDAEMMGWKLRARFLLYEMFHSVRIILGRYYYNLGAESEMAERMRLVKCLDALTAFKMEDGMTRTESIER
ncbi:hypothetical protein EX30DRAFT_371558 [Ascodesmis nigricans]|uniref:Aminoglycoside phosphotransferase domain-containing protein n=1 Tax=Ascodesmis nigricans TaxID=341454 RepID=A0A4V3SIR6_9PEZI|nr:hypothetical protein EX30DRAFT_371558 [Ascodesmis nigricans]